MINNLGSRFQRKKQEADEDWMTTFADMVTLLLTFFIMLVSISKVDVVLFEQVKAGVAKGIGNRDEVRPIQLLKIDVQDAVQAMKLEDVVAVGTDDQGLTIEFASSAFYEPGSAEIREEAIEPLTRIAATIGAERYRGFQVEVQGHTDDTGISTQIFASNWELSAARATRVVRFFADTGIAPERMEAIGYADTRPKVPNRDAYGDPLPANQEVNRRVVVRVYPR
ncbi:flagellar motor protein MotB [Caenispirillum bisanense]|uniref:Chemotaxis protein MotB n=1 Tax=Caenispirillum bisanense TaxID=414052 RepID=A0A286H080_9PROT|nr:flagellar motor protein MotB [Caenispirillum bisanense]SOE01185.1 chemotaxis protein MotB [Caenispirillum bisanense]